MSSNDPRFDIRVQEHTLREGQLEQAELDKFLAELPDDAENAIETETRMVASGQDEADADS